MSIEKIKELVEKYPRHYARMIASDNSLLNYVNSFVGSTISEKVFQCIYGPVDIQCNIGNKLKFTGINTGYKFCGRAGVCRCAASSVSKSISHTKQQATPDQNKLINDKRASTNIEKYGVANIGQTKSALEHHAAFYNDINNVNKTTSRIKKTKLNRYGNENYNNSAQIKETWIEKANDFWQNYFPDKDLESLCDKETLSELFDTMTVVDIAARLNVHIQTVYKYLNKHKIRIPYQSSYEQEIVIFLRSLGIDNIIQNTRTLLPSRKEIDIYLPDYKIAIEFNGIYWHHEDIAHITKTYHHDKFIEAEKLDIQLITIFSNFWNSKKEVVKKSIINKLGLSNQSSFARKGTVKQIRSADTSDFLNEHHIQGYTPASIVYGFFDETDTMQAVMSFSKSRIAIGKQEDGYELVRYASAHRVVGGAGKLLAKFKKDHPNEVVYSYSNNEWSNGKLYKSLGFDLVRDIPVSYWYIHPREEKLMHRFNFSKHKLVEKGYDAVKSESVICKELGLLKIWDCGKRKWILNI